VLAAAGKVVAWQAGQLIKQPLCGEDFQERLHLARAGLAGGDDQVEVLSSQGDEAQSVGAGGRFAGDAGVGHSGGYSSGYLQVPGRVGVVAGQLAGVDSLSSEFSVEHATPLAQWTAMRPKIWPRSRVAAGTKLISIPPASNVISAVTSGNCSADTPCRAVGTSHRAVGTSQ
jgi:hypothetical protein